MLDRNHALALLAGADAAPQTVALFYGGSEEAYRRAVDAFDALGVPTRVEWRGDYERLTVWLGDTNELVLHGPKDVRTHAPIETLAKRSVAVVPDWAA